MTISLPAAVVAEVDRLPPLPAVVVGVLRLLDDPRTSGQQIAESLGRDPVLTSRVLRLANSAWYTWTRRISTIQEAVVLVGFSAVRSQILGAAAFEAMRRGAPGYALNQELLWQHSVAVGVGARHLARRYGSVDSEEAFVAGLLHDIGKVVLGTFLGPRYDEVTRQVEMGIDFAAAERTVLGCDHAQVGAEAARRWNLPDALIEAIEYHHRPLEAGESRLTDLVHVADALALTLGFGVGADQLLYPCCSEVVTRVGIAPSTVDALLVDLAERLVDVSKPFEPIASEMGL